MGERAQWKWYNGCSYWRLGIADDESKHDAILRPYICDDGHPDICVTQEHRNLIAAAPELLNELNRAIAYITTPQAFDSDGLRDAWIALKIKAEGR